MNECVIIIFVIYNISVVSNHLLTKKCIKRMMQRFIYSEGIFDVPESIICEHQTKRFLSLLVKIISFLTFKEIRMMFKIICISYEVINKLIDK